MFADVELARRLERTEGFAGASFVRARGVGSCAEIDGCYAMFDGPDSPLTQTFGLGMTVPATPDVLTRVEEFFHAHRSPILHEVCPLAGVDLIHTLARRGYLPFEISNVMFLELPSSVEWETEGFNIRVGTEQDIDTYASTAGRGWGNTPEAAQAVIEGSRAMFMANGHSGFLVEQDGETVATAGLVIHGGVALFAGASTVPEARGRGAQRAVLGARLQYAAKAGCEVAMMVAEVGGTSQRNAERCGFRIAYTRTKWRLAVTS